VSAPLPVAVDVMGGDKAPHEILAGAEAAAAAGIPVILVGTPEAVAGHDLPSIEASQVIDMAEEPGAAVRQKKDSSLVRAAEAVRDGRASSMVSAGNTGAAMAASLLRMKRLSGVARPAIAAPLPLAHRDGKNVLLDAGANAECQPEWLVQFARMGAAYMRARFDVERPRVGLLSIGEEPTKGTPFVKDVHALLLQPEWQETAGCEFVGNVEGRDLLGDVADVIVTDGFTGNVALKTIEGAAKQLVGAILGAFDMNDESRAAADVLLPSLLPLYQRVDPDNTGGAALLGLRGVSIISHGSSSAKAIENAIGVAHELVERSLVAHLGDVLG